MWAARKRRSVPMELPHSGMLLASRMCSIRNAIVCARASSSVTVEARIASIRPDRVCIAVTTPSMRESTSSGWWMTRSGPSAMTSSSSSVMIVAISTMTSRPGSRPVISRSIQASTGRL